MASLIFSVLRLGDNREIIQLWPIWVQLTYKIILVLANLLNAISSHHSQRLNKQDLPQSLGFCFCWGATELTFQKTIKKAGICSSSVQIKTEISILPIPHCSKIPQQNDQYLNWVNRKSLVSHITKFWVHFARLAERTWISCQHCCDGRVSQDGRLGRCWTPFLSSSPDPDLCPGTPVLPAAAGRTTLETINGDKQRRGQSWSSKTFGRLLD